ncbi:MAG: phosphodiesterase [Firmicutes bacterium]|nr:phosphodiesterase [Bacillota bacterium]
MKIGVISDTHGSLAAWEEAFANWFSDADLIIHAGDIFYHGPRNPLPAGHDPMGLAKVLNQCRVPLIFARGNCEAQIDLDILSWPVQNAYAFVQWEGLRILVDHMADLAGAEAPEMARRFGAHLLIAGHTHQAYLERRGDLILLNPGSPALSKLPGKEQTITLVTDGAVQIIDVERQTVWKSLER